MLLANTLLINSRCSEFTYIISIYLQRMVIETNPVGVLLAIVIEVIEIRPVSF